MKNPVACHLCFSLWSEILIQIRTQTLTLTQAQTPSSWFCLLQNIKIGLLVLEIIAILESDEICGFPNPKLINYVSKKSKIFLFLFQNHQTQYWIIQSNNIMEESPQVAVNLFTIRRTRSRPGELKTTINDFFRAKSRLQRRPFSGEAKPLNMSMKKEIPRRHTNFKSTSNQLKIKYNHQQQLNKQNDDLISTSSTFQPPTLKEVIGVTAESFCVLSKQTKEVLYDHNMSSKRQIASLTKMMTAYTVLSICKQFNIDLWDTVIRVQKEASEMEGTTAGLRLGDQLSVVDLLHGMMLPSGNDAAVALAQYFGKFISFSINKSDEKSKPKQFLQKFEQRRPYYDENYSKDALKLFVFKMNYLAHHDLRLKDTYFANPTGLQHYRSYSTAYDIALVAMSYLESSVLHQMSSKKIYQCQVRNQKLSTYRTVTWRNTNTLLWKRKDCSGLKTGFTPWAGPCLAGVFTVHKQQSLVIVVLKSSSKDERFNDVDRLYQWHKKKT